MYKVLRKFDQKHYAMKQVKIKGLSERERESALNEVRLLASIRSPFILTYREAFWDVPSELLW